MLGDFYEGKRNTHQFIVLGSIQFSRSNLSRFDQILFEYFVWKEKQVNFATEFGFSVF